MTPEAMVLNEVLEYLRLRHVFAWRNNTGATKTQSGGFVRYGMKGSADIIGILPDGRFLAIECKRAKGGKVSEAQKWFLENVLVNNGVAILAHSWQDVESVFKTLGVIK